MDTLTNCMRWCREERDRLVAQRAAIERGTKIGEDHGRGWVDRTDWHRATIMRSIDALERLLRQYEDDHLPG